jgi:small subunit ribosomal protein S8
MQDLISDMLIRLKNGYNAKKTLVFVKYSKTCLNILHLLYLEGFINGFSITKNGFILVKLKYFRNDNIYKNYFRISKPGRRIFLSSKQLKQYFSKKTFVVISTNKGLFLHTYAILQNIGGEVLFELSVC